MNEEHLAPAARSRSPWAILILTALGLLVGGAAGWTVGKLIKAGSIRDLPWSDSGALVIGMMFLVLGVLMAVLAASRWGRAILADPHAPDFERSLSPVQASLFWPQAGVLVLAGVMLVAPVAYEVAGKAAPASLAPQLAIAILAAFVTQTALNLLIWVRSDEVMRRAISESGAVCFWLIQGLLFLWAAGEKLDVLPSISSWDTVTVLMGVYLITSSILAYRRGLA